MHLPAVRLLFRLTFFFLRFKDTFFFHQNHNTVKWKAKGFPIRIKLITFSYQRRIQSQRYYAKADPFRRLQQTLSWRQHRRHFGVKGKGSRGEAAAGGAGESPLLVLAARGRGTERGGLGLLTRGRGLRASLTPTRLGKGARAPQGWRWEGWCGIPQEVTACGGTNCRSPGEGSGERGRRPGPRSGNRVGNLTSSGALTTCLSQSICLLSGL